MSTVHKIRKGTRSCWECKRRKIKCIFSVAGESTCISCQRRRTPCISQYLPESLSPANRGNRHLGDRISRVEDVVKDLLAGKDASGSQRDGSISVRAPPTPSETPTQSVPDLLSFTPASIDRIDHLYADTRALQALWDAFPVDSDVGILLKEYLRTAHYTHVLIAQPHSQLTLEALGGLPHPEIELPAQSTHPVLVARCMLMLAITLQTPSSENFAKLSTPPSILGRRLVTAAAIWITNREEMQGTVEGLMCIILEAMYESNCGNLRRAWVVYRRAMTIAQMMGIHRTPVPPVKRIEPSLNADPESMWFRIVYMDRYLSLLLGLPQGILLERTSMQICSQNEPPLGQFERALTVIASGILERNDGTLSTKKAAMTQSIDSELLKVSKNTPANFWWPADFQAQTPGSPEYLMETLRLSAQVYYFSLLIQLHLPYMMCGTDDKTRHEYSRISCVNAGREIMTRFIAHRSFNPKSTCARPIDFFALLAAMTLLLAHLDAHRHTECPNFLAHQRLSDLAIVDRAFKIMNDIGEDSKDAIMEQSAKLVRRLVVLEADVAEGRSISTGSKEPDGEEEMDLEQESEGPHLRYPYFGIIASARHGPWSISPRGSYVSRSLPYTRSSDVDRSLATQCPEPDQVQSGTISYEEIPSLLDGVDDWVFQGVDVAFFDSLIGGNLSFDGSEPELNAI